MAAAAAAVALARCDFAEKEPPESRFALCGDQAAGALLVLVLVPACCAACVSAVVCDTSSFDRTAGLMAAACDVPARDGKEAAKERASIRFFCIGDIVGTLPAVWPRIPLAALPPPAVFNGIIWFTWFIWFIWFI